MPFEVTTDQACIDKMLKALPFADNDAGLDETAVLIRKIAHERDHMKAAIVRIATPEAFHVATSRVDPEAFARMTYAQCVIDGHTLKSATEKTEYETRQRYPLRGSR